MCVWENGDISECYITSTKQDIKDIKSNSGFSQIHNIGNNVNIRILNLAQDEMSLRKLYICNIDILGCRYGHQSISVRANRIK